MMPRRIRRSAVRAVLATLLPVAAALPSLAGAQLVFGTPQLFAAVSPGGFTSVGGSPGANPNPLTVNQSATATSAHADLSGGSFQSSFFGVGLTQLFVGEASANGVADATFGGLHLAASATAHVSPYCYGCGGTSPGAYGNNPYYASVKAGIGVGLTDWFQLTSPTLAVGTPVTFDWGYDFHRIVNAPIGRQPWSNSSWYLSAQLIAPDGSSPFYGNIGSYNPLFATWLYSTQPTTTSVVPITGKIGDVFQMILGFGVDFSIADDYYDPATYPTESVDASNTLSVVFNPTTAGLTIRTASGYDYITGQAAPPSTTTPEPATFALLAAGLLVLLAVRTSRSPRTPA